MVIVFQFEIFLPISSGEAKVQAGLVCIFYAIAGMACPMRITTSNANMA